MSVRLPSTFGPTPSLNLCLPSRRIHPSSAYQRSALSSRPSHRRTNTLQHGPFLHLPAEIRFDIYESALLGAYQTASRIALLQTCRQISMEARSTLYKRPTSFKSQAKLLEWIEGSRPQDLRRVRTLTLRLTDIDLSSLLDQSSSPRDSSRKTVWALYQAELDHLNDALKALPNLSNLVVVPPQSGRSHLLKGLYHSFLGLIPARCPKLRQLEIQDGEEIVDAVPALKDLPDVKCTGDSTRKATSSSKDQEVEPKKEVEDDDEVDAGEGMDGLEVTSKDLLPAEDAVAGSARAKVPKPIVKRRSKSSGRGGSNR